MSRVFLAFSGISEDGKLPVFYDAFIQSLHDAGHSTVIAPHRNWGAGEWGGLENMPAQVKSSIKKIYRICALFSTIISMI